MSLKYGIIILSLLITGLLINLIHGQTSNDALLRGQEKGAATSPAKKSDPSPSGAAVKETSPNESPQPIVEKNIFSPERKDFPAPSALESGNPPKPKVRPQITLYGVTLADDYQSASLVQSGRSLKKGERELVTVKVGDRIADYKVAKILTDKILLESEADQFEVLLYDPKTPKRRMDVRTEAKPASVTSTVASSTTPGEVKREAGVPQESTTPSTTPAPAGSPRRPLRREGTQETRDPSQGREAPVESPSTGAPPPTPYTPPGMPSPATPLPAPMRPTPIPIPPGMGNPLPPPSQ